MAKVVGDCCKLSLTALLTTESKIQQAGYVAGEYKSVMIIMLVMVTLVGYTSLNVG